MSEFFKGFVFAWKGICIASRGRNFRVQLVFALATVVLGAVVGLSTIDWLIVLIMIGLVLSAEIFNSSIEYLVDLVSPKYNELAGKVKDLAAGAVLVFAFISLIIGIIIFVPYILIFLQ